MCHFICVVKGKLETMMDLMSVCLIATITIGKVFPAPFLAPGGDNCMPFIYSYELTNQCAERLTPELKHTGPVSPSDAETKVYYACSKRLKKRTCMANSVAHCANATRDTILTKWDNSFQFCKGEAPAAWITEYAGSSSGTVPFDCIKKIINATDEECLLNPAVPVPLLETPLQEGIDMMIDLTAVAYNCMTNNNGQLITSKSECNGVSWKDAVFVTLLYLKTRPVDAFTLLLPDEQMSHLKMIMIGK